MPRWSGHTLRRRVQFHELDLAGIVHFSCFFRYMEEAEHALWREAGLSIAQPGADFGFPRVATSFDFHKPLRFEEEFDARIRIVAIAEKTIRYSCVLTRGDEKLAAGTLTSICVSKRPNEPMRARPIPAQIAAKFQDAAASS